MNNAWSAAKEFAKDLYCIFLEQRPTQLAAGLAFYGLFSLAPILFIAKSVAQVFINVEVYRPQVIERLETVFGPQAVPIIQKALDQIAARTSSGSWLSTTVSIVVTVLAAIGFFFELQYSLNRIWEAPRPIHHHPVAFIRQQLLYFAMVIGLGLFLILAVLLNLIAAWLDVLFELSRSTQLLQWLVLLCLFTFAFAIIYKVLPNETIHWQDVWLGALLAGLLMILGGLIFGIYIRVAQVGTSFAAGGAFIVLLIGMYYFAQIFLFGAMFARVYALRYGSKRDRLNQIVPNPST